METTKNGRHDITLQRKLKIEQQEPH